jgi:branched-subunit amino acid ABC-type transport system permease component
MHMLRRLAACSGIDLVLVGAAVVVIGRPDLEQARTFAVGEYPTFAAAQAALELLLWTIILAVVGVVTVSVVSEAARRALRTPWRQRHLTAILATAALLLAVATLRHASPSVVMCCGNPSEAITVAR